MFAYIIILVIAIVIILGGLCGYIVNPPTAWLAVVVFVLAIVGINDVSSTSLNCLDTSTDVVYDDQDRVSKITQVLYVCGSQA